MILSLIPFIKKETLHIVRDSRTLAIVLLIPVILMFLFGFAISTEVNNVNVLAVTPVQNDYVRGALSRISENPDITFKGCIAPADIDAMLRQGKADAVVVFGNGTPPLDIELVMDASKTGTVQASALYVQGALSEKRQDTVPIITRTLYNPQMKSAYNFVPGIMGMLFILICAMMTSVSIVREKETGTMEVLLVSPVRPMRIVFAKLVPYFTLSCIVLAAILLIAYGLLELPFSASVFSVILVSLLYIVLSLAIGILISTMTQRQMVALLVSAMLFMLPVIMLSGMLFPVENMPAVLQWISCIVPARWYIDAMRKLMIEQLPIVGVLDNVIILITMVLLVIFVAVRKFNDKLE